MAGGRMGSVEKELAMILEEMMPLVDTDFSWQAKANCRGADTDLFFLEKKTEKQAVVNNDVKLEKVRALCGACRVKGACLNFALNNHITHGVWGGQTYSQRRVTARERRHRI